MVNLHLGPDGTRIVIEDRDRGCRVPGCERSAGGTCTTWSTPWTGGGGTDAPNLLCLCQHHHRLHHRGQLGIEGNSDEPGLAGDVSGPPSSVEKRLRPRPDLGELGAW